MTIRTKQEAHDTIADAVYWLSGFAAAREDSAGVDAARMAEGLREVQVFMTDKMFESATENGDG